jgi:hypothetical protein
LRMFTGKVHPIKLSSGYRFVVCKWNPQYIYGKWLYNHDEYKACFPNFKSK